MDVQLVTGHGSRRAGMSPCLGPSLSPAGRQPNLEVKSPGKSEIATSITTLLVWSFLDVSEVQSWCFRKNLQFLA